MTQNFFSLQIIFVSNLVHQIHFLRVNKPVINIPFCFLFSSGNGLDSKPFRCSYCPKEFGHLSSLESHVERLHTNESRHHCETCGRAFSSKSNLTAHKKIHTGTLTSTTFAVLVTIIAKKCTNFSLNST